MIKYKCGCESDGIILMGSNIIDFIHYKQWSESDGVFGTKEFCIYCWLEKHNLKANMYCKYLKGKWVKNETTKTDVI